MHRRNPPVTLPSVRYRTAFRPTETLAGPQSVTTLPRWRVVGFVLLWLLWYAAAQFTIQVVIPRMAPRP